MPLSDYRRFVGRDYEPPHGCFRLVEQVFREAYGWNLGALDAGLDQHDVEGRTARLHEQIARLAKPVESPQEGDVILVRSIPWHIGVIVEPGYMLHSYAGGSACIEPYTAGRWKRRVEGFYRYTP